MHMCSVLLVKLVEQVMQALMKGIISPSLAVYVCSVLLVKLVEQVMQALVKGIKPPSLAVYVCSMLLVKLVEQVMQALVKGIISPSLAGVRAFCDIGKAGRAANASFGVRGSCHRH